MFSRKAAVLSVSAFTSLTFTTAIQGQSSNLPQNLNNVSLTSAAVPENTKSLIASYSNHLKKAALNANNEEDKLIINSELAYLLGHDTSPFCMPEKKIQVSNHILGLRKIFEDEFLKLTGNAAPKSFSNKSIMSPERSSAAEPSISQHIDNTIPFSPNVKIPAFPLKAKTSLSGLVRSWSLTTGKEQTLPTELSKLLPAGGRATQIATTPNLIVFLDEVGKVFTWQTDLNVVKAVELPEGRRAVSVTASSQGFLALLDDGSLAGSAKDKLFGLKSVSRYFSVSMDNYYCYAFNADGTFHCFSFYQDRLKERDMFNFTPSIAVEQIYSAGNFSAAIGTNSQGLRLISIRSSAVEKINGSIVDYFSGLTPDEVIFSASHNSYFYSYASSNLRKGMLLRKPNDNKLTPAKKLTPVRLILDTTTAMALPLSNDHFMVIDAMQGKVTGCKLIGFDTAPSAFSSLVDELGRSSDIYANSIVSDGMSILALSDEKIISAK